jgi:hypothetical protein
MISSSGASMVAIIVAVVVATAALKDIQYSEYAEVHQRNERLVQEYMSVKDEAIKTWEVVMKCKSEAAGLEYIPGETVFAFLKRRNSQMTLGGSEREK